MKQETLTLAVISGNCQDYIERFLRCFRGVADEIVLVRAIGSQSPDDTKAIAEKFGCKVSEYFNREENAEWPHVDDFAAARNMAFDMATCDWVMWADIDDIVSASSIGAIRDLLRQDLSEFVGVEMLYDVPEDGIIGTNWRERICRRGEGRWINRIHENLVLPEGKILRFHDARIIHAQGRERRANDERNLRILESIPLEEHNASTRFHTFQSLRAVGRMDEAKAAAASMITNPPEGLGTPERYELFVALGQLADDPAARSQMMLQAMATDPGRREAFGELALCMIGMGRDKDALAYTTAMRAIEMPSETSWNQRGKYYGYLGEQLHGMALRANGRFEEADAIETNHFIRSGCKISLIHATRGRVKMAIETRRAWLNSADNPNAVEHIFGLDLDDPTAFYLSVHNHAFVSGADGPVAAWNRAADKSRGEILVQLSDDWEPVQGWDTMILDAFEEALGGTNKQGVLAVSDGNRNDDLLCMAIMTRPRYKAQGHMFHPEFFSMYSDNWFSDCAWGDGIVVDARQSIRFNHAHPAFGKAAMDATYSRTNGAEHYIHGKETLRRLSDGISTSADLSGWCDYRPLYDKFAEILPENGRFVEIGSWMGQSITRLAQHLQDHGKKVNLFCVDTWRGEALQPAHEAIVAANGGSLLQRFTDNLIRAKVLDMVSPIVSDSAAAAADFADASIDGIFVDAAHDYDSVVKDLAAWWPKLKPGGIWAGHDYPWKGVRDAVNEHAAANGYEIEVCGRCWIAKFKP
jgi:predicted O-methyltransferase YrrM